MNAKSWSRWFTVAALALLTTACGGGGEPIDGGSEKFKPQGVGSGGSGRHYGRVSAFHSVIVNGVEYSSSTANIIIDDNPNRPEAELKTGMVVTVQGDINAGGTTGVAEVIEYDSDLKGTVDKDSIIATLTGGRFAVYGQPVTVTLDTVWGNAQSADDLVSGNAVEVSGLRQPDGTLNATRVELRTPTTLGKVEIKGTVKNVTATTFEIGTLKVNYAGASRINFPPDGLHDKDFIEVKANALPTSNQLTASSVEIEGPAFDGDDGEQADAEGFVAGLTGSAPNRSFTLNDQAVATNSSTVYENGSVADLANAVPLQVSGTINGSILVAVSVQFKPSVKLKAFAQVTAKSAASTTLTLFAGAVPGIETRVNANTTLEDQSTLALRFFGYTNINVNDWLEVEGYASGPRSFVATKLIRRNAPSNGYSELEGPLDADPVRPNVTILGVTGITSAATRYLKEDDDDGKEDSVDANQFFSDAKAGHQVLIRGQFTGTAINIVDLIYDGDGD